ncbi:hypothetical protein H4R34_005379 [Dimargaris verticillata]|uniref:Uncharacterized protein n=1 Tax=Dimargaris verticillata TaxID=2761393 RepID=A0A9W8AZ03_9FUNG|nr:hypothetical protein H4R34_005379 [Dimargaris verticillata]
MKLSTISCIAQIAFACVLVSPIWAVDSNIPKRSKPFKEVRDKFIPQGQEPLPPVTERKTNAGKKTAADEKYDDDLVAFSKQASGARKQQDDLDAKLEESKKGK